MTHRLPTTRRSAIATALALLAAPALAQQGALEEVIVTAEKRTETVQDIAATVNVVTGADLDKFASFQFGDIEAQTSGIGLASPNARNSSISMRGVGTDPEAGVAAAVDSYWNDISVRADIVFNQVFDLARIEILRGPQGTLQGRTSPAGAIKLVTNMPSLDEREGYVQATGAQHDGFNGQLGVSLPLIEDVLAIRVAGVYDQNNANDVTNLTTGVDNPQATTGAGRFSALWQPADTLGVSFVYEGLDRDTDDPKAMAGVDSLGQRPTLEPEDKRALGKTNDYGNITYNLASLTMDWEVGDHVVTWVSGYNDSNKKAGTENDRAHYVTNPEQLTNQRTRTKANSWSQELRLASSGNDFWDYMFGLYYFDQDTRTRFFANTTRPEGIALATKGALPVNSNEAAAFTYNTFNLSSEWILEAGLRYTYYERSRKSTVNYDGLIYVPPPLLQYLDQIEKGISAAFPIDAVSKPYQNDDEDALTGSLKLRYEWTDDVSLYASYSRGYRPGGISIVPSPNVEFLPNGEQDLLHDSEDSDSIELGVKSRFWDGRAELNAAVYYVKYDGYLGFVRGVQVVDDMGEPVDLPGGIIFNGDANVWGSDVEGRVLLTDNWTFGGSLSYVKSEWDNASKPCNERQENEVLGSCSIDGDAIGGEPEWSASLQSEYAYPLRDTEVYGRVLYKYTGNRINTDASAGIGNVQSKLPSNDLLNLYLGWREGSRRWDVFAWVKNALDEDKVIFQQGPDQYDLFYSGGSYTQTNIMPERTFGVTASLNF